MKWLKFIKRTQLRKRRRQGSYIVEAVIVMPVFIVAVTALMSMVPAVAVCENIVFSAADEMRMESVKSAFRKNPAALPPILAERIEKENKKLTAYHTKMYRYLYRSGELEDLLSVHFKAVFSEKNPVALFQSIVFDGTVTGRAFTGKLHRTPPGTGTSLPENDRMVYIFPEWGMRYHGKNCTYVKAACRMVYLSQDTKRKYRACSLCNASQAQTGSPVFCFVRSGRAYHLAGCRVIARYYIEIGRRDASAKGYTPCTKCGGG